MTTLERLLAARALVARGWTQGANARDAMDCPLSPCAEYAVSFCAYGAVGALTPASDWAVNALVAALPPSATEEVENGDSYSIAAALIDYNDDSGTSKTDVLALYDRAINRLGGNPT